MGVLALQGAFVEHILLLQQAAAAAGDAERWVFIEVRTVDELMRCDALIIPGGESTAISLVAARSGLLEPLREFVKYVPDAKSSHHRSKCLHPSAESKGSLCGAHVLV